MKKWNQLALNIVMIVMGVILIVGSALSTPATVLFPFDTYFGVRASVAGIALGAGIALSGFNPRMHPSWARLAIFYCILDVLYELVTATTGVGGFNIISFVMAIIFAGLIIYLYPNRGELVPGKSGTGAGSAVGSRV
ncbi:MAG TPA: hypothetical protein VK131_04905 [Candidatus Acidoferrales bacterium]|nr:hypothetical protein [Candidatus Acidoferrales bacterium]